MSLRFYFFTLSLFVCFSSSCYSEVLLSENDQFTLSRYQDNYVLPYYFTDKPNQAYFAPQNPNGGNINKTNVQFQFSLKYKLLTNIFTYNDGLYFGYTQKSNWQAYDKSAYFRDTDYQPDVFWVFIRNKNVWGWTLDQMQIGLVHQSNGKGGIYERSWNRAFLNVNFSKNTFNVSFKPWLRLHVPDSRNYNSDISDYMGYGRININWQQGQQKVTLTLRNLMESDFSKGYQALSWRFPLYKKLNAYLKLESGYGLTVSNYNHYNNAFGIGISL